MHICSKDILAFMFMVWFLGFGVIFFLLLGGGNICKKGCWGFKQNHFEPFLAPRKEVIDRSYLFTSILLGRNSFCAHHEKTEKNNKFRRVTITTSSFSLCNWKQSMSEYLRPSYGKVKKLLQMLQRNPWAINIKNHVYM